MTSPNPSEGGGQEAVANNCVSVVVNKFGENVLHPSFGGDGGGQKGRQKAFNPGTDEKAHRKRHASTGW